MDSKLNSSLDNVKDWKDAIYQGGKKLVSCGLIKKEYLDSIIQSTNKYGAYYVVADKFAIAHSEIDTNIINETCWSWNLLSEPITFIDKEVKYLIILATKSPIEHQDFLKKIAQIFMNDKLQKEFYLISNLTDLNNFITKYFS